MYAAADFDFNQADNGWLTSEFAFMRGFVLIFIFPRIVSWGRSWFSSATPTAERFDPVSAVLLPSAPKQCHGRVEARIGGEALHLGTYEQGRSGRLFDLVFLRWSLVVDGALTTMAAFSTRPWHVYLGEFPRLTPSQDANPLRSRPGPALWIWLGTDGQGNHLGHVRRVSAGRRPPRNHVCGTGFKAGRAGLFRLRLCQLGRGAQGLRHILLQRGEYALITPDAPMLTLRSRLLP